MNDNNFKKDMEEKKKLLPSFYLLLPNKHFKCNHCKQSIIPSYNISFRTFIKKKKKQKKGDGEPLISRVLYFTSLDFYNIQKPALIFCVCYHLTPLRNFILYKLLENIKNIILVTN